LVYKRACDSRPEGGGANGEICPSSKEPPKWKFREWKEPPKTPKRVLCPGSKKALGGPPCELNKSHIISTDDDPGLRIESFAVINLCGVSTNKKYYMFYRHANLQRTYV
jgi:hypothetical protein